MASCEGTRPNDLGVINGLMKTVKDSPNNVSSQANLDDEEHYISPLNFNNVEKTIDIIRDIVKKEDGTKIIKSSNIYLYAEFKTSVGWVDDVEFYLDTLNQKIHFRSASRIGHSDLGTNRERIEQLKVQLIDNIGIN